MMVRSCCKPPHDTHTSKPLTQCIVADNFSGTIADYLESVAQRARRYEEDASQAMLDVGDDDWQAAAELHQAEHDQAGQPHNAFIVTTSDDERCELDARAAAHHKVDDGGDDSDESDDADEPAAEHGEHHKQPVETVARPATNKDTGHAATDMANGSFAGAEAAGGAADGSGRAERHDDDGCASGSDDSDAASDASGSGVHAGDASCSDCDASSDSDDSDGSASREAYQRPATRSQTPAVCDLTNEELERQIRERKAVAGAPLQHELNQRNWAQNAPVVSE